MTQRWFNALLFLLLGVYALYLFVGSFKRQTVVACEFQPEAAPAALRFGPRSMAVRRIYVDGSLGGDGEHGLYHYDGTAQIMDGGRTDGSVSGAIFLTKDGAVEGLLLWISHPTFGQRQLSIATLNADGFLDRDRSTAFLSADPADKQTHPASFSCRSERNYQHIYQALASFNWLAFIALLATAWAIMFFAKRKAESAEFGGR